MTHWHCQPYERMIQKLIFDAFDRFPDAGNRTIARLLNKENPEIFTSIENTRSTIRYYRGAKGAICRSKLKNTKYVRQPIQAP